ELVGVGYAMASGNGRLSENSRWPDYPTADHPTSVEFERLAIEPDAFERNTIERKGKNCRKAVAAFVLVFMAGAAALAWYNWRVTGNPLDPPYLAYRRVYGTPQPFLWQPPLRLANFRYPELRENYLKHVR